MANGKVGLPQALVNPEVYALVTSLAKEADELPCVHLAVGTVTSVNITATIRIYAVWKRCSPKGIKCCRKTALDESPSVELPEFIKLR